MARFSPVIPLVGAQTRFQPVYVGDVAEALSRLIETTDPENGPYEFGGPEVFSLRQLVSYTLATTGRRRLLLPLPWGLARTLGTVLGMLPRPMLTADQVELLKSDIIVSAEAEAARTTLRGLGIAPEGIEAIVPAYLYRYRKAGQFTQPNGA